MKKALITGINGQDGFYLNKLLRVRGVEVVGVSRSGPWERCDFSDEKQVFQLIEKINPDVIFHLAADSSIRHDVILSNHQSIVSGTLHILEAVKELCPESKIFIAGSGLQFSERHRPIDGAEAFDPWCAYSLQRIQSVEYARYYRKLGLKVYVGYLFHHESPRRSAKHLSQQIAQFLKSNSSASQARLEIGSLEVTKEWAYAGDIVKGILTLMSQDNYFEAVIGTGAGYSIREWLNLCFSLCSKNWEDYVTLKQGFKSDYPYLVSNPKIINSMGWTPKVSVELLAKVMLGLEPEEFLPL